MNPCNPNEAQTPTPILSDKFSLNALLLITSFFCLSVVSVASMHSSVYGLFEALPRVIVKEYHGLISTIILLIVSISIALIMFLLESLVRQRRLYLAATTFTCIFLLSFFAEYWLSTLPGYSFNFVVYITLYILCMFFYLLSALQISKLESSTKQYPQP